MRKIIGFILLFSALIYSLAGSEKWQYIEGGGFYIEGNTSSNYFPIPMTKRWDYLELRMRPDIDSGSNSVTGSLDLRISRSTNSPGLTYITMKSTDKFFALRDQSQSNLIIPYYVNTSCTAGVWIEWFTEKEEKGPGY